MTDFLFTLATCALFAGAGYMLGWNDGLKKGGRMTRTAYQTGILDAIDFIIRTATKHNDITAIELGTIMMDVLVKGRRDQ